MLAMVGLKELQAGLGECWCGRQAGRAEQERTARGIWSQARTRGERATQVGTGLRLGTASRGQQQARPANLVMLGLFWAGKREGPPSLDFGLGPNKR